MQPSSGEAGDFAIARTSAEVVVRVGLLLLLAFWCFSIAQPFLVPIVWGMVIAVAVHRGYDRLRHALGGRAGLAATLVSVVLLLVMILPLALLSRALVDDVAGIAGALTRGEVRGPAAPGVARGLARDRRAARPVLAAGLGQPGPGPGPDRAAAPGGRRLAAVVRRRRRLRHARLHGRHRHRRGPARAQRGQHAPGANRRGEADGRARRRSRPPRRADDPRRRPRRARHGADPVAAGRHRLRRGRDSGRSVPDADLVPAQRGPARPRPDPAGRRRSTSSPSASRRARSCSSPGACWPGSATTSSGRSCSAAAATCRCG